ncbi:hypothetical protein [Donghicola mangrovi]|uniref:Uncharacterized protein n=1 Tax=Donghicola mangrovi TaxID=2729614 RepID=A0A850Q5R8_9RHOB|nr:hypothetical protein [Donghicola mangrovi]NVO24466.1 hypothetical protein [Donghicola mangrovi]
MLRLKKTGPNESFFDAFRQQYALQLAAILSVSLISSFGTLSSVVLLHRFLTVEVIFGVLAPIGAVITAFAGAFLSLKRKN